MPSLTIKIAPLAREEPEFHEVEGTKPPVQRRPGHELKDGLHADVDHCKGVWGKGRRPPAGVQGAEPACCGCRAQAPASSGEQPTTGMAQDRP
jgi:hypothetical protein